MKINLDSWIIQDGNYKDFQVGEVRDFALEFWSKNLIKSQKREKSCTELPEGRYEVCAEVVYLESETHPCVRVSREDEKRIETPGEYEETVVVLDLGGIMVFDESRLDCYEKGGFVEGIIGVGIDPFFYKESHCNRPGIPALTYSWKIEKIEMLTAPWIETWEVAPHLRQYVKDHPEKEEECKRRTRRRDEMKIAYKEIERTNVWEDDGCRASYLLTVSKL